MKISQNEYDIALESLEMALKAGADKAKVCLDKNSVSSSMVLDGEFDSMTYANDNAMNIYLYADGRFGSVSTNRIEREELKHLIARGVETVRMLAPDTARDLPDTSLYYISPSRDSGIRYGGNSGFELEVFDTQYDSMSPEMKRDIAMECAAGAKGDILSGETEFADQITGSLIADTQGFVGLCYESIYSISSEITIRGKGDARCSGMWWDLKPAFKDLSWKDCACKALSRAQATMNPRKLPGGKYNLVLENTISPRVISPILSSLSGGSIHQHLSFLMDSAGKQVFPEWLSIVDRPLTKGALGARLFDSEGVATKDMDIIRDGVVKTYFIDSYSSRKLSLAQTIEGPSRVIVESFDRSGCCNGKETSLSLASVLKKTDTGILVTAFNGGNTNQVTGAFSFGIEGFYFQNGQIVHPVREMLVTSDILSLMRRCIIAGTDPLGSMRMQIPTLAFEDIDFNG